MFKPSSSTFYVHNQKSLKQLQHISYDSLTGSFTALIKVVLKQFLPPVLTCYDSSEVIFGSGAVKGVVMFNRVLWRS